MRLSVGVDIIEIERIRASIENHPTRFLAYIYTQEEIARYRDQLPELAARFAGKEAVSKVLGTGVDGFAWRDIEILSDALGKPIVRLAGGAQRRAEAIGIRQIEISLSHCREYAVAFAAGYG
jgi:holo-[acyl-carrier protein] synthase